MPYTNILLIDNYDSFTYNLEHLLALELKAIPRIIQYHELGGEDLAEFDLIIISPGPGKPSEYPDYRLLKAISRPVIGICLGMQIINELHGGKTARSKTCVHGKTDSIEFDGRWFEVARYHSLYTSRVAECFEVLAHNADRIPMAIRHRSLPLIGYQFHPESFLTEKGAYFIRYAMRSFTAVGI